MNVSFLMSLSCLLAHNTFRRPFKYKNCEAWRLPNRSPKPDDLSTSTEWPSYAISPCRGPLQQAT